jgi:uncharacterized protein (DUF736 family)
MATIGKFRRLGDSYTGTIQTLLFSTPAALEPVEKKSSKKGPDFKLILPGNREIGAAWEKASKDGDKEFLSVTIDDPSLAAPINCALFEDEDGEYALIWSRDRQRARR